MTRYRWMAYAWLCGWVADKLHDNLWADAIGRIIVFALAWACVETGAALWAYTRRHVRWVA